MVKECDAGRDSCCDDILIASTNIETHATDIKGLKQLYKPVYMLCLLFVISVALILAFRADTKEVAASVGVNREKHVTEVGALNGLLRESLGRYDVIESMLFEIREDQKNILKWQREHK